MWRKTLITTLAMLMAAGLASAQNKPAPDQAAQEREAAAKRADQDAVAKEAAEQARAVEEQARRQLQAAQNQVEPENARVLDRAKRLGLQQREEVLRNQKLVEVEKVKAQAALRDAQKQGLEARYRNAFVAKQPVMKREKVAFFGVGTSDPPPVLVEQLKLTPRQGMVVDFVEPQSPAEQSGVKQYDVLLKFDDQKLINPEQLRALVRLKKPGDDVKVSLIRQGQPMELVIELGEKEVEEPVEVGLDLGGGDFVPGDVVRLDAGPAGLAPAIIAPPGGEAIALTNVNGHDQAVWTDGKHKLAIELTDGKATRLTVTPQDAPDAKPLFEGPIENDKQREAVPAEFLEKLKKAETALPKPGAVAVRAVPPAPAATPRRVVTARRAPGVMVVDGQAIAIDPANGMIIGGGNVPGGGARGPRVITSTDKDNLMLGRVEGGKIAYVLVFSQADGKTVFEGRVTTPEERKTMPEAALKQLEVLEKNQNIAPEFGVIGRQ
jgi:hypothetical protein